MAATTTTPFTPPPKPHQQPFPRHTLYWPAVLILLTLATLLIDGYHPFVEDGGLYVAGIQYRLDPSLFPHDTAFVTAHLHYSLFAPVIAASVRLTHLPLAWLLFAGYLFSLWLLLYAGLQLLRRCIDSPRAQLAGVALLAVWSSLPVAGTSLMLVDPYLTARSFTTPLSLLAIAFALDTSETILPPLPCLLCLAAAALLHPLMALNAAALVVFIRLFLRSGRHPRPLLLGCSFAALTVAAAAAIYALAPPDTPALAAASLSRYYWFLSQWQWYELCGLLGPFAIFALLLRSRTLSNNSRRLLHAALAAGSTAILLALLFAHADSPSHLVARLQPLRLFLLLYAIMALLLGAALFARLHQLRDHLHTTALRAAVIAALPTLFILSAIALFTAQRASFPTSQHLELPWLAPTNPWSQAFLWIRANTPRDALFALDPDYITAPGEDAQAFRATAQRSALPDFSKDGGEASITPPLAPLWQNALTAQSAIQAGTHLTTRNILSTQTDTQRYARLHPLGVTWLVLQADAPTTHPCAYINATVKVCRLVP